MSKFVVADSRMEQDPPGMDRAIDFYRRELYAEARDLQAGIVAAFPTNIRALRLLSRLEALLGNTARAIELLDEVLSFAPDHAATLYDRGILSLRTDHQQLSVHAEAEDYFRRAIAADPTMAEAHFHLGAAMAVQTRHIEAIPHYLEAVHLNPGMTKAHYELAKAYHEAKRDDEAREALQAVLRLDGGHSEAAKDLKDLLRAQKASRRSFEAVRFPHLLAMFDDVGVAIKQHVLGPDYPVVLNRGSRIATFGSCFAGNIARALREIGMDARNTTFGESINSTPANRQYVDWVVDGVENEATRAIVHFHAGDPNFSMDRGEHIRRFTDSDIIVMTVGVAPCFFDRADGSLVIPRPTPFGLRGLLERCEFRTTSVAENVENLRYIVRKIRELNPSCVIIVTVSPVPLSTTFEYKSAVVADTVSKATLRVAVDELLRLKFENLLYWPSFEVVRWLGCYVHGMYGQEDGSAIHVSESVIAMQMQLFIDVLSGGALGDCR